MSRARAKHQARTCVVAGCGTAVSRTTLLCSSHLIRTPRLIREAMMDARATGRFRDWFAAGDQAALWHRANPPAAISARIIGERDEPSLLGA